MHIYDQNERFPPKVRHYCWKKGCHWVGWGGGSHHGNTEGQKSIEETKDTQSGDTGRGIHGGSMVLLPAQVLQDGHTTGLTLNDHETNASNKQARTLERVSRCTWSSAVCLTHLSKIDSCPSVHPRMWACVLHRVVWENKPNVSCTIELFCGEIGP